MFRLGSGLGFGFGLGSIIHRYSLYLILNILRMVSRGSLQWGEPV